MAGLDDVAVIGVAERDIGVLLGDQKAHAFLLIQFFNDIKDLAHQLRGQTHGRLIQQQHLGFGHHRPGHGDHLLLPARGKARLALAPDLEALEIAVNLLQFLPDRGLAEFAGIGTGDDIFLHGQVGKTAPALQHLHQAPADHLGRVCPVNGPAIVADRAAGDLAPFLRQHGGDGLQGRALAGAVAAQKRHDPASPHAERDIMQGRDDIVIHHADGFDLKDIVNGCVH